MGVIDHKCLSCGATLPFNPETQRWDCEYCGASYSLIDLNESDNKTQERKQKSYELNCYHCPDCGAEAHLSRVKFPKDIKTEKMY